MVQGRRPGQGDREQQTHRVDCREVPSATISVGVKPRAVIRIAVREQQRDDTARVLTMNVHGP